MRRRISLDMLHALREAEAQLVSWRNSPLRPLLEDALASVDRVDLDGVASDLESTNNKVESFDLFTSGKIYMQYIEIL